MGWDGVGRDRERCDAVARSELGLDGNGRVYGVRYEMGYWIG